MSILYARVIANPAAGGYSVTRDWGQISRQLQDTGLSFDHEFTRGKGHAMEIARQAADAGYRCIVAVGGDGTVNEVVNGILNSSHPGNSVLGIINTGTSCNFARSLGIPQDYAGACSLLTGRGRTLVDVGVVQYRSQGRLRERFFLTVADVGFGSEIVNAWRHLPERLGQRINHALRTVVGLGCLLTHRNKLIRLRVADDVETIRGCTVIVANGQYYGDGMLIAPQAKLDDGLLDVVTVGDMGRYELLKIWPALYTGSHIGHPKIKDKKIPGITVESDEQLLVQADGDILGSTPASFKVIPSALTVLT